MGIEIERKFLLKSTHILNSSEGTRIVQGYLSVDPERTVRVRIFGEQAFLTIKGKGDGIARSEFEYEIPILDAEQLLEMSVQEPIEKIRHLIEYANKRWEVDRFLGKNEGLYLAEIELEHVDEAFSLPDWIGQEVSGDHRYFNSHIAQYPFSTWLK